MLKYIVVVVVIVLVLWLMLGRRSTSPTKARRAERRAKSQAAAPEGMVTCAHCGVHLPGSEALLVGNAAYCSEAHRAAGPADETK